MNSIWYYLLIALGLLVVLLVILFSLNRKFESVGNGTGYICGVLANILVHLEKRMVFSSLYFHNACRSLLQELDESGNGNGNLALRLSFYCALGCLIFLGEIVGVMTVLHAMSPTMPDIASSTLAEFAQAALFLATPALFGDLLLSVCKIQKTGLIHSDDWGILARLLVGFVFLVLLVFSIAVNSYFYMYKGLLLSSSLADHQTAQQMIPYILTGLGLAVSFVSPFALMAIYEGIDGAIPLLAWIAEMVCKIIATLASFVPRILNVISTRLGGESVYNEDGIVIDNTTIIRVHRVAIDSLQTQRLASSLQATNILADGTIVASVDDNQTVLPIPVDKTTPIKLDRPEKKLGVRRKLELFNYEKQYLSTPEQSSEQPKDTSQTDTVKKTNSRAKRKPTTRTRTVKVTPAPSLNGREKVTAK